MARYLMSKVRLRQAFNLAIELTYTAHFYKEFVIRSTPFVAKLNYGLTELLKLRPRGLLQSAHFMRLPLNSISGRYLLVSVLSPSIIILCLLNLSSYRVALFIA